MYGAARDLYSVGEVLLLGFKARKGRQQGRMDIEDPLGKLLNEPAREEAHVSSQTDQIYLVPLESRDKFAIVVFSRLSLGWNYEGVQPALARRGNSSRVGFVGDDDGDASVRNAVRIDAVGDGDEIGATSGEKNAKRFHGS